jgi:hypothetical protein
VRFEVLRAVVIISWDKMLSSLVQFTNGLKEYTASIFKVKEQQGTIVTFNLLAACQGYSSALKTRQNVFVRLWPTSTRSDAITSQKTVFINKELCTRMHVQ